MRIISIKLQNFEFIKDVMEAFDEIKPTVNASLSKKYTAFRNQT